MENWFHPNLANIFVAFEIQKMILKSKMFYMKIEYAILKNIFLVLAIFMPKNHKNVKLGKKCVPFREKIRFAIVTSLPPSNPFKSAMSRSLSMPVNFPRQA